MSGFDYKSKRWLRVRAQVLREAGYRCQYARRFGKRVEATHVHHIWPAEDYPEYAWERWNLIALSQESHNAMHDRVTGALSTIGEQLRRRTVPPHPRPAAAASNDRRAQLRAHAGKIFEAGDLGGSWENRKN